MLKKYTSLLILLFFISISTYAQWLEWENITTDNLTLSSVANSDDEEKDMEPADLNNDGYDDLIVVRKVPFSNPTEPQKSDLLLINVNGELIDQTELYAPGFITNPTHARDVFIGDFDNDGWKDVIIANTFNQMPLYYRNRGNDENGNWKGLVDESATRFPATLDDVPLICAVKGGDINGDGAMDIYFVNYKQNSSGGIAQDFLFINDGNGVFTEEAQARLGNLRNSAFGTEGEIKDVDNDGDNDIIKVTTLYNVAPWNNRGVIVLYNEGDGNFTNWQNISAPVSASPYMIEIEDFNLDGKLDVYVIDDGADYLLIAGVITPDNNIAYTNSSINSPNVNGFGGNVHAIDFDLDGDMDLGVADVDVDIPPCTSGRRFALLRNDNGVFNDVYGTSAQEWAVNTYDFSILDVNNDGLPDFILGQCEGYGLFQSDNCDLAPNSADFDLDGIADACDPCPANPDPNCAPPPNFPTVSTNLSVPRQWNELLLASIRRDLARPTVHARNLFHTSAAMWDIWAAYHEEGCTYLLGQTINDFTCSFDEIDLTNFSQEDIETSISFAMYRILTHRFANSTNANELQQAYDHHMNQLGLDPSVTNTNYVDGNPIHLGNYIGQCYINYGLQDNSNEQNQYANTGYEPVNDPLVVDNPGNPNITDLNRWQPLTLDLFIDQSGNVIPGATPDFLSPEWGSVAPFALLDGEANVYQRNSIDYKVFHDPGTPPLLQEDGSGDSDDYKWGFSTVVTWSSHLDPTDGVLWDISPAALGNSNSFPSSVSAYPGFYDQLAGGTSADGHSINPVTGQPYAPNIVPRGDFARVLAEFWADGPDSETPPGHWFTIINEYVADHPDFEKRFQGQGPILDDLEWYIKSYFMLGGAMHDAAVTSWGIKGWYDYIRPISAIRAMADRGQSSSIALPSYDPQGIPLIDGYIELINSGDPLAGAGNVNVGKIKIKAWRGHEVINNVDTDEAGVDWILAEKWEPYQRPSFVTPNFAGYVSGHSTYSSSAARVLTLLTGSEYFPGGMGSYLAKQDEFLVFEDGPSVDVELQWATYQDAANQSALSRIWGGIHPPADDIPGRLMGIEIGTDAFNKALSFFADVNNNGSPDLCEAVDPCIDSNGDSDGDGICDDEDNCPSTANPDQADSNGNGIGDVCDSIDPCIDLNGDSDGDGICDDEDNCPNTANPNQADSDGNGIGDLCDEPIGENCDALSVSTGNGTLIIGGLDAAPVMHLQVFTSAWSPVYSCAVDCDPTEIIPLEDGNYIVLIKLYSSSWQPVCEVQEVASVSSEGVNPCDNFGGDTDGDGICDDDDNCPDTPNPNQNDSDGDGIGDACDAVDPCAELGGDSDGDGICDDLDNCPNTPNPNQTDSDNNGIGDACEGPQPCAEQGGDTDGDGICNDIDNCPNTANPDQEDSDGNGIGDVCDEPGGEDCDAITVNSGGGNISVGGLNAAPVVHLQIFTSTWSPVYSCANDCNPTETINLEAGSYIILVKLYSSSWQPICEVSETITVSDEGSPCDDAGGDTDGDGICNDVDNCPNNPNSNQADTDGNGIGDICEPVDPCSVQGGDSDNDGICDDEDPCPNDPTNACQVTPPCSSNGTNTNFEYIQSIVIGDISNSSGDNSGYADYTTQSTNLLTGENYAITLEPGFTGNAYVESWHVMIDFNGDGDFSDAGEILFSGSSTATINDEITIPANAPIGSRTLRIAMQYNAAPPLCGEFQYGEVEDYTAIITGNLSCNIGSPCDDGNVCTINDQYNADCNCSGIYVDSDGDGVCDEEDNCPTTTNPDQADEDANGIGDACDNPTMDDCSAIEITNGPGSFTVSGYNNPIVFVKVYDSNWSPIFDSGMLTNNESQTISGLSDGAYIIAVQTYDATWNQICNELFYPSLNGDNFISGESTFDFQVNKKAHVDIELNQTVIFPNPAHKAVFINLRKFNGESVSISIMNTLGQKMSEKAIDHINSELIRFDLANYPAGIYTIYIDLKGKRNIAKQLVVMKE